MTGADTDTLKQTPLHGLHVGLGGRMVPFAGYEMPVQYPAGIVAEHRQTRLNAGLFDVSHMGQAVLAGPNHDAICAAMERLVPGDIAGLARGRIRYTQFTNPQGGIIDDLMVTRPASEGDSGKLFLVVNASRKDIDYAWMRDNLPADIALEPVEDRALIAIQGPAAEAVLARHCPPASGLAFMSSVMADIAGIACQVSRCGYTGEDGFEISVPADQAQGLAETFLAEADVEPVGLGARDTLRLEAGLCLYGNDIDETTSPVEADLVWSIGKRRREAGGFIGEERILKEIAGGTVRRRAGLKPAGRAPAREGSEVQDKSGNEIGVVTSGGFGPTVEGPVAMGYVETASSAPGTPLDLIVRQKAVDAEVVKLPFVKPNYKR